MDQVQRQEEGLLRVDSLFATGNPHRPYLRKREYYSSSGADRKPVRTESWCADRLVFSPIDSSGWSEDGADGPLEAHGLEMLRAYPFSPVRVYRIPGIDMDAAENWLDRLEKELPAGVRVERDEILYPAATTPDDPRLPEQWALSAIHAEEAWDSGTGAEDAVVAVIDTGLYRLHEDFYDGPDSNVWSNPEELPDGLDNDGNGLVDDIYGWDFVNETGTVMVDENGHGTKVAGILGAFGNNGTGIAGTAWRMKILPLRAGVDNFLTSDLALAMDYATDLRQRGYNVIATNNSYGYKSELDPDEWSTSTVLGQAIERARLASVMVVAASGNNGQNNDGAFTDHFYPSDALHHNVISVGASSQTSDLWNGSNYGLTSVDLAAPGVSVVTTTNSGSYGYNTGTSFAAPHVSAALVLLATQHPSLNTAWMRELLLSTVQPSASMSGKVLTGGILDLQELSTRASLPLPEAWKRLFWDAGELASMDFNWSDDEDRDGWNHLAELAFGGNPRVPDRIPIRAQPSDVLNPQDEVPSLLGLNLQFSRSPLAEGLVGLSFEAYDRQSATWQAVLPSASSDLNEDFQTGIRTIQAEFLLDPDPALLRIQLLPPN